MARSSTPISNGISSTSRTISAAARMANATSRYPNHWRYVHRSDDTLLSDTV